MHVSRNKVERAIEKRLTEAMNCEKPPIGPELAQHLAEWGQWLGNRDGSCRSSDWHLLFFSWAIRGRAAEFKQWAEKNEGEQVEGALAAIQKVYEFNWPHNLAGYMFGQLWGWLQVGRSAVSRMPRRVAVACAVAIVTTLTGCAARSFATTKIASFS
jgi:hypothetical protein